MDRWNNKVQICYILSALETCSSTRQALQIHGQLLLTGLHRFRLPLSKLISFLSLSSPSNLPYSHLLFSRLSRPNIFIYNTMIRGFSRSDFPQQSISIFKSLLLDQNPNPNNFTFPFLLNACSRLPLSDPGLQIHCHVLRSGFGSDIHIINSLLDLYSSFKDSAHARRLFDQMSHPDLVSFNIIISCYAKCGHIYEALWLFRRILDSKMNPDCFTFVSLLPVCSASGNQRIGRAVHQMALKHSGGYYDNSHLKSALVDMYARFGMMKIAECVFESMGDEKTAQAQSCMVSTYTRIGHFEVARKIIDEMPQTHLILWTAMISSCSQTGRYKEALNLFIEMEKLGLRPDAVAIVAVLPACAELRALNFGKRLLHMYVEKDMLSSNSILVAAVVDMYAKCGRIITAFDIFNQAGKKIKTLSLFNIMISGLAQHGHSKTALSVFREMEKSNLVPNDITFVGVLCACSRRGLIEEGRKYFAEMQEKYGIRPQIEHYGCMVELLGRVGLVEEAYNLAMKMPEKINSVILLSLLRACRIHKNTKARGLVEKHLVQLDENSSAKEFILSQIFSEERELNGFRKVRRMLAYKPAIKELG